MRFAKTIACALALGAAVGLAPASASAADQTLSKLTPKQYEMLLGLIAEELNKDENKIEEDGVRLDRVLAGPGMRLTMRLSVDGLRSRDAAPAGFAAEIDRGFSELARGSICADETMRQMADAGVAFALEARAANGDELATKTVTSTDCQGVPVSRQRASGR